MAVDLRPQMIVTLLRHAVNVKSHATILDSRYISARHLYNVEV